MTDLPKSPSELQKRFSAFGQLQRQVELKACALARLQLLEAQMQACAPVSDNTASASLQQSRRTLEDELQALTAAWLQTHRELEALIRPVENPLLREVLERHYLQLQTVPEIAEHLHYSGRHVNRLRTQALAEILRTAQRSAS